MTHGTDTRARDTRDRGHTDTHGNRGEPGRTRDTLTHTHGTHGTHGRTDHTDEHLTQTNLTTSMNKAWNKGLTTIQTPQPVKRYRGEPEHTRETHGTSRGRTKAHGSHTDEPHNHPNSPTHRYSTVFLGLGACNNFTFEGR